MFKQLFLNEWKENIRSPYLSQSIIQRIFIGLLALYVMANVVVLGIFIDQILEKAFPDTDPFAKFNAILFYYFLFDIMVRFFLQQFPVISIKPYLSLPVKKSTLIHFLLLKSIPSFFNLLPLLVIIPFFVKVVLPGYPLFNSVAWLLSIICIILTIHFLSFFIKKNFDIKPGLTLVLMGLVGSIYYLDTNGYLSLSSGMEQFMLTLMGWPVLALFPVILLLASYFLSYRFFKERLYLDKVSAAQEEVTTSDYDFGLFNRFGHIGELMRLEMKMIWRNKRSRNFIYISVLFLLYPLVFISNEEIFGTTLILLLSILITGMFAFNYAQLLLSWHSTHFDYILTRNISGLAFFKAKFYLMAFSICIAFVLTLPYGFLHPDFFYAITAAMLFNIGASIFFYMYIANYNSKKIDPSKGSTFNFEGFGAAHYLVMIPIMILPLLIYWPFAYFGCPHWGLLCVGAIGLIGILFREKILARLVVHFKKRKYHIAAAFRQQ